MRCGDVFFLSVLGDAPARKKNAPDSHFPHAPSPTPLRRTHTSTPGPSRPAAASAAATATAAAVAPAPTAAAATTTITTAAAYPGFAEATTMAAFPPAAHDAFALDDLLTPAERGVRSRTRAFMEAEVAPVIAGYWERAEFPHALVPGLAALGLGGGTISGHGCPGHSVMAMAMAVVEMARVDASMSTFLMVHNSLAMLTIGECVLRVGGCVGWTIHTVASPHHPSTPLTHSTPHPPTQPCSARKPRSRSCCRPWPP